MLYWSPFPSKPAQWVSDRLKTDHLSLDVVAVSPWGLYTDGVTGNGEVRNKLRYPDFTAQLLVIYWKDGSCITWDPHVVERKQQMGSTATGTEKWLPIGERVLRSGDPHGVYSCQCWCLLSALSSKQQWQAIKATHSLCALRIVQKQVRYCEKKLRCLSVVFE